MNNERLKISIITVVKNGMPFLIDALKSFNLQNYTNKEHIVVYGDSNDGTTEYLFKNGDAISLNVYDWSNAMSHADNYDVAIDTVEFINAFKRSIDVIVNFSTLLIISIFSSLKSDG